MMAPSTSLAATVHEASKRCEPAPALALRYALLASVALAAATVLPTAAAILLAWLGAANLLVAHAYARGKPGVFGKHGDGSLAPLSALALLPYLVLVWGFFVLKLAGLRREPCFHEAAPKLYVGRWPRSHELPEGCALVVDLTGEFPRARSTSTADYLSLPILNRHVPSAEALLLLLRELVDFDGVLYVHCGAGRGRSAMVTAALLFLRGCSPDLDAAVHRVKTLRPGAHIHPVQRRLIDRVCPLVRPATGAETPAEFDRSQCA